LTTYFHHNNIITNNPALREILFFEVIRVGKIQHKSFLEDSMTSRERVAACFAGQPSDRPAVINPTSVATVESMAFSGASFPHVHTNATAMAELASTGYDILGFDTVMPYFSVVQEAAALGCEINWGSLDSMPMVKTHPIQHPDDFTLPKDFLDKPSIKTVLDAITLLHKKYSDTCMVIGKVMGPLTLAYHLHGTEELLMKTLLEPNEVHDFLEVFSQISLVFAHAQFEAGADMLTWADHATGDLISPEGYREFLFPVHQRINRKLKKAGPVILHTCGKTLDRMELFGKTGFEAFHFDSLNDPNLTLKTLGDSIRAVGCINNQKTLLNGTPLDVAKEVQAVIDAGIRLVAPECAIPCRVPNINLQAIVNSVRSKG
jgi:[methyl-Co(III) methanol-specific corrinoid protein]:coenzyme M methyltransferase